MTRSSSEPLHAFDPEIERTLHRLRKARHTITLDSSSSNSIWNSENSNFTTDESISLEHQEAGTMENNDRTLKELATPDVVYQPWCIQCPPLEPAQIEPGHMKNNDRTLKELATPDVVYQPWCIQYPQLEPAQTYELKRGPPQTFEGIPRGLFHNEIVRDTGRLHQNEGISILPGWSSEGLAVSSANAFQHLGRHEAHISGETAIPTRRRENANLQGGEAKVFRSSRNHISSSSFIVSK
ncbi:hypothetical protein CR513_23652, partial [Mucuna pruriens]